MKMHLNNRFKLFILVSLLSSSVAFAQSSSTTASASTSTVSSATSAASSSSSVQENPQVFTQGVVTQVLAILNRHQISASGSSLGSTNITGALPEIEKVLSTVIDLKTMSTFLVPPKIWNGASSADQLAFENSLLTFMTNLYGGALAQYTPQQYQIDVYPYRGSFANLGRLQINSTIVNKANAAGNVSVAFVLESVGDSWMFLDFSINNSISVAQNVQAQIQSIIQTLQTSAPNSPVQLSALTAVIVKHNNQNSGS